MTGNCPLLVVFWSEKSQCGSSVSSSASEPSSTCSLDRPKLGFIYRGHASCTAESCLIRMCQTGVWDNRKLSLSLPKHSSFGPHTQNPHSELSSIAYYCGWHMESIHFKRCYPIKRRLRFNRQCGKKVSPGACHQPASSSSLQAIEHLVVARTGPFRQISHRTSPLLSFSLL